MMIHADSIMIDKISQTLNQIHIDSNQKSSINMDIKYDPFYHDRAIITTKPTKISPSNNKKNSNKSLSLAMILNKKAFINGTWYKKNQKVAQYMLDEVNQDSVVLKGKNKTVVLKLETTNNLLIKKEAL